MKLRAKRGKTLLDKNPMLNTDVGKAQEALRTLGYDPGSIDGIWGRRTLKALNDWQRDSGKPVTDEFTDEIIGELVALIEEDEGDSLSALTPAIVSKMCPGAPISNILEELPHIKSALRECRLTDKPMVLMAIATIRAETGMFAPLSEGKSQFNTDPREHPFNRYDNRKDLGNTGAPDGARYRGRGFIQLTGRANYRKYGKRLGIDLEGNPSLANTNVTAAAILACFLSDCATKAREALAVGNYARARKLVNGGSHGLSVFEQAYKAGLSLLR